MIVFIRQLFTKLEKETIYLATFFYPTEYLFDKWGDITSRAQHYRINNVPGYNCN